MYNTGTWSLPTHFLTFPKKPAFFSFIGEVGAEMVLLEGAPVTDPDWDWRRESPLLPPPPPPPPSIWEPGRSVSAFWSPLWYLERNNKVKALTINPRPKFDWNWFTTSQKLSLTKVFFYQNWLRPKFLLTKITLDQDYFWPMIVLTKDSFDHGYLWPKIHSIKFRFGHIWPKKLLLTKITFDQW